MPLKRLQLGNQRRESSCRSVGRWYEIVRFPSESRSQLIRVVRFKETFGYFLQHASISLPSHQKGRVVEWMLWMKTRLLISALFVFQKFDYDWKPEWSVRMSDNPLCYTLTQMTCWRIDSHSHPQEMSSVAKCGRLMQSSLWSKHQKPPLNQHRVPEDGRKKVGWWNNTIDIYCRSVLPLMKLLRSFCILN